MEEMTFDALYTEAIHLYHDKRYAEAVALVEQGYSYLPEQHIDLAYVQICLEALQGKTEQALQTLQSAIDKGYWYGPDLLKQDDDLRSLQDLPDFQRLYEICAERANKAQRQAKAELTVVEPTTDAPWPAIIALHGNNGNVEFYSGRVRHFAEQGFLLAVPQSSQIIGPNAYGWNDYQKGTEEVQQHLETIRKNYPVQSGKLLINGYSMGGGLAIYLALSGVIKVDGFVVHAPYLRDVEVLRPFLVERKAGRLRGYITVGTKDTECLKMAQDVIQLMLEHDLACQLELIPDLGHSYSGEVIEKLKKGPEFIYSE